MKKIALAVLAALSLPVAASAGPSPARAPDHLAPPPALAHPRQDAPLRRLVAGWLEALDRPGARRQAAALEAQVALGVQRELAAARADLAALRRALRGRPTPGAVMAARARVERLESVREDLAALQGRFGWRAVERKAALGQELLALTRLDAPRRGLGAPPVAVALRDRS